MNLEELKSAWQVYDQKLRSSQAINEKIIFSMIRERSNSRISSIKRDNMLLLLLMFLEFFFLIAVFAGNPFDFDYLWQFLNYPITNQEFYNNNFVINKTKPNFDFEAEIEKYNSLSYIDQLRSSADRIEKNGVKNAMIFDRLSYKRNEVEVLKFNQIVSLYNDGINELNLFITFRNNQFKPNVSDEELKKMIDSPKMKLLNSKELLDDLSAVSKNNQSNVTSLKAGVNQTLSQVEEQFLFVEKYLSKSKTSRKTMFTKVSWFGIPIN